MLLWVNRVSVPPGHANLEVYSEKLYAPDTELSPAWAPAFPSSLSLGMSSSWSVSSFSMNAFTAYKDQTELHRILEPILPPGSPISNLRRGLKLLRGIMS